MRYAWVKDIPGFINYFNEDHRLIIDLIGIDNYLTLREFFGKRGIYFPVRPEDCEANNDRKIITALVGDENYRKLSEHFSQTGIYFSSVAIIQLKKAWVIKNRHIHYNEAADILDVSARSIYKWRQEENPIAENE